MTELRNLAGKTGQARAALDHAGRPVLSVPVVALVGDLVIHAVNSEKPELVPVATLSRAPHEWAQKPVVLGHPKDARGRQISANSPAVLERHAFGTVSNPRVEKNKLCVDALIDEARAEKLGGAKFLQALRDGVPQEVSVGCFVSVVNRAGEQGGRRFAAVWENLQPDHLAFLVDSDALGTRGSRGACSIQDGCGTARYAEDHSMTPELRDAGGPGSGWTAENGHVPGGSGGEVKTHYDSAGKKHTVSRTVEGKTTHYRGIGGHTSVTEAAHSAGVSLQVVKHGGNGSEVLGNHTEGADAHDQAMASASGASRGIRGEYPGATGGRVIVDSHRGKMVRLESRMADESTLITALTALLRAIYTMYATAHTAHWNIEGPLFPELHSFFGDIYDDVFDSADPVAEAIRQHGAYVPSELIGSITPPVLTGGNPQPMVAALALQNTAVLGALQLALTETTGVDEGLANLLQDRLQAHKKYEWQLSAQMKAASERALSNPEGHNQYTGGGGHQEGDRVRVNMPGHALHGQTVIVHQVSPQGTHYGVNDTKTGKHAGYFDGSNLTSKAQRDKATATSALYKRTAAAFDKDAPMESRTLAQRLLGLLKFRSASTSFTDVQDSLEDALRAVTPNFLCVDSVYTDNTVVYMVGSAAGPIASADDMMLMRRSFSTAKDGTVTLKDDAEEVEAVTTYEPKALGGPGSGWTAENGHVPGGTGGAQRGGDVPHGGAQPFTMKGAPGKLSQKAISLTDAAHAGGLSSHHLSAYKAHTEAAAAYKYAGNATRAEWHQGLAHEHLQTGLSLRGTEKAQREKGDITFPERPLSNYGITAAEERELSNPEGINQYTATGARDATKTADQASEKANARGSVAHQDRADRHSDAAVAHGKAADAHAQAAKDAKTPITKDYHNTMAASHASFADNHTKAAGIYASIKGASAKMQDCELCDGTGQVDSADCKACDGTGEVPVRTAEDSAAAAAALDDNKAAHGGDKESGMNQNERAAAIKALTECPCSGFDTTHLKMLEAATDEQLVAFAERGKQIKAAEDKLKAAADGDCPTCKGTGKMFGKDCADCGGTGKVAESKAAEAKPMTAEEFLKVAPEEIRSLVARQKKADAAQKAALVGALKAAQDAYSEADLQGMAVEDLARLAKVARVSAPDFSGRGVARSAEEADVFQNPPNSYDLAIAARNGKGEKSVN